jgi:two-component system alkaline phosphatase synthesis response regulator PhoP
MARILIVEDEPAIAMALEDDLTSEGYQVEVLSDGETASRRACAEPFDLVLLDVMLPRRSGFEVCRDLRRAGTKSAIIVLTAKTQEAEKVLGFELGADDYVTKPYSPPELRARIKAVLRRASGKPPEIYRFGDVEVDFTRCQLRRGGSVVETTPLEFKLLAFFVRREGRALTRQQLLDEVWGHDTFVTERSVDNQVTNLRKKIEPVPAEPRYIASVRGVGYRFDAGNDKILTIP